MPLNTHILSHETSERSTVKHSTVSLRISVPVEFINSINIRCSTCETAHRRLAETLAPSYIYLLSRIGKIRDTLSRAICR